MNVSYTYIDGKVIIFDENGNQVPVEYYDNLDEVLVQENVVETIENEIKELGNVETLPKKRFIPFKTIGVVLTILITPLILNLVCGINLSTIYVNTLFGETNLLKSLIINSGLIIVPFSLVIDVGEYLVYKSKFNNRNAKIFELEFLKSKLVEEKQKLEDLKKENTKEKEDSIFTIVKINDLEKLKQLRHKIELYYSLGYDIEKLYKYLENGTLEDKLNKSYNSEDIQLAKAFLEENGPTLIKRKK